MEHLIEYLIEYIRLLKDVDYESAVVCASKIDSAVNELIEGHFNAYGNYEED